MLREVHYRIYLQVSLQEMLALGHSVVYLALSENSNHICGIKMCIDSPDLRLVHGERC